MCVTSMVAVAQLAERLVVVQEVAGSSPVSHPITPGRKAGGFFMSMGFRLAALFLWVQVKAVDLSLRGEQRRMMSEPWVAPT